MAKDIQKKSTQITGNIGLYYVCYQLSRRGWNVLPTARNAKGIDIVAYKEPGEDFISIQVKTLSGRQPVPLGKSREKIAGDYWIIVTNVSAEPPDPHVFILRPDEVKQGTVHRKNGGTSWLNRKGPKGYESADYQDAWHRLEDPTA